MHDLDHDADGGDTQRNTQLKALSGKTVGTRAENPNCDQENLLSFITHFTSVSNRLFNTSRQEHAMSVRGYPGLTPIAKVRMQRMDPANLAGMFKELYAICLLYSDLNRKSA